jgi:hypothetical protein
MATGGSDLPEIQTDPSNLETNDPSNQNTDNPPDRRTKVYDRINIKTVPQTLEGLTLEESSTPGFCKSVNLYSVSCLSSLL